MAVEQQQLKTASVAANEDFVSRAAIDAIVDVDMQQASHLLWSVSSHLAGLLGWRLEAASL